jgi:hypothetical protein
LCLPFKVHATYKTALAKNAWPRIFADYRRLKNGREFRKLSTNRFVYFRVHSRQLLLICVDHHKSAAGNGLANLIAVGRMDRRETERRRACPERSRRVRHNHGVEQAFMCKVPRHRLQNVPTHPLHFWFPSKAAQSRSTAVDRDLSGSISAISVRR